jgi:hypothetical protein
MRLSALSPRWVNDAKTVFVFRCPHCEATTPGEGVWISCKSVPMGIRQQFELFTAAGVEEEGSRRGVVPMREDTSWSITGDDFETMSVSPSIDASASGHWHGCISVGECAP